MASVVHPAGIWTVTDEGTDRNTTAKTSAAPASLLTDPQHAFVNHTLRQDVVAAGGSSASADIELSHVHTLRQAGETSSAGHPEHLDLTEEHGSPDAPASQGIPPELPSLLAEVVFVLACAGGQLVAALLIGHVAVTQAVFTAALGIPPSQAPWLLGASMLPCGLSVIISGSLADLMPPKPLMVGAFVWEVVWNVVAAVAASPRLKGLFFFARAMQGLAAGVLVSASMSILGRVYQPGIRKTRVFSLMAAGSPFGYWLGCLLSGALSSRIPWIFGSPAILMVMLAVAAQLTIPDLRPAKDNVNAEAPSLRQFDYIGAGLASVGCTLIIFGLTQGDSAHWNPYTYSLIIVGFLVLGGFYFVERRIARPLIPSQLWQTPGFGALLVSYFLGLGAYSESVQYPRNRSWRGRTQGKIQKWMEAAYDLVLTSLIIGGAWQWYAIQFWQRYQGASPLTTALYLLPNGIVGILAAYVVSKTLHIVPTHVIFTASMIAFALGPVFFLPQSSSTNYWALSMPGVALATFGPDMSFTAAAIFITSSVPRSYQGAAGSLLVTVQNLTVAVMTSISGAIGTKVGTLPDGDIGLAGIKAIWWFGLAAALAGALITATRVRIPRAEEKEHVH